MNLKNPLLYVCLMVTCPCILLAAPPVQNPVDDLLIQPDVVLQNREQLKLSGEQVERIRTSLEEAAPRTQQLKERAEAARERLAELLAADEVDKDAALRQLDVVVAVERDQQRLHLQIMIQLRSELTPQQRQLIARLQRASDEPAKSKKSRTKEGAQPPDRQSTKRPLPAETTQSVPRSRREVAALDNFYRPDEVQSIHLRITEEDRRRMLEALPERIYVSASFRWRGTSVEKVAIRFKGNSSSAPNQRHKRSFLIKFDQYDDDSRFFGLRRVSFDNGVQFGSLFSEPIITEILRDQGIKTHRSNYARLYINDQYQGVYVNVERIDESFVEHHLPDPSGLLFKVDLGGPGANLQFLGDDPSAYKRAFEAKNVSAKEAPDRLVEFIRMINQVAKSDVAASLEAKMELDDFLGVTAVMLFSGAFDQLTGWNPHNYYLYYDREHDRWRYLPWDLDVGFSEIAFGQIHVLEDWNAAWPVAGSMPNPLLERIIADPALLQDYRRTARTILDKYFQPEHLCTVIDAKYELIKQDLKTDPFPHRRVTVPSDKSYDDIVESMKKFVRKRYASALRQLKNPGPRPELVQRRPAAPPGLTPQLARKIQRIQQRAQQMAQKGEDISAIQKVMQRVGPLLQRGKSAEAAKLLDEALKLVSEEPENKSPPGNDKARRLPKAKFKRSSPEEVQSEVVALKKQNVAWRKIAWKTCLLDGLRESRDQKKPIMLWVFIDRPIDDERC